ncbi:MAG TPA: HYR domain-containing protein, partial [Candidatus Paceibacterota bacterium]|nr:HYR domain-containing protein [Candidatus Paceibacterota bacterium]
MKKALVTLFISLGLLVPALAFANSAPKDTTPPVMSSVSDKTLESATGVAVAVTYTKPTATDSKDGSVAVTCTPASGSTFALGNTTVTCSAQDAAGNKAQKTFKVIVKDTTPPTVTAVHIGSSNTNPAITVPGDTISITFTTSEKVQTPVVLVNAKPLIMRATNATGNNWVASYTVVAKDPLGRAEYAIALADTSDNVYACSSIKTLLQILVKYCPTTDGSSVTVSKPAVPPPADTTAPVIAAHANVSVSTTNSAGTAVSYTLPTATDNKDGAVAVVCTPASGSTFVVGDTTVNCSAHDAAGNTAASSFIVGVSLVAVPDTTAPVIAAHADVAATTTDTSAAVSYTLPVATDNKDGSVAVTCTPISGSTFALGTTPINCSAQDAAGNVGHSSFNVVLTQEVVVPPGPTLYTMASQPDESFLCKFSWRLCFTPDESTGVVAIDLGQGSTMGDGALQTATIALDENDPNTGVQLWL